MINAVKKWDRNRNGGIGKMSEEKKMKTEKKVSFRVRRIYYDQFAAGNKNEELRALTPYWLKILCPVIPERLINHPLIVPLRYEDEAGYLHDYTCPPKHQPKIAVVHTPKQPTLTFQIDSIWIDQTEHFLRGLFSEEMKKIIPTEFCIVTRMRERIP